MTMRFALFAPVVLMALTAAAPAPRHKPAVPPPTVVLPDTVRIALTTDAGAIVIDLDAKHAPVTVANFVRYAREMEGSGLSAFKWTAGSSFRTTPGFRMPAGSSRRLTRFISS